MKVHARRRLEGWDFKDLASGEDPIYPHVTTLHALGKGWVDFLRSIQAIKCSEAASETLSGLQLTLLAATGDRYQETDFILLPACVIFNG